MSTFDATASEGTSSASDRGTQRAAAVTVHDAGSLAPLLAHAGTAAHPTDCVIASGALQRRVIKRRLAAHGRRRDRLAITTPVELAMTLSETSPADATLLDRTDRLRLLEELGATRSAVREPFETLLSAPPETVPADIETYRRIVERHTGFHSTRIQALKQALAAAPAPARTAAVTGAVAVEQAYRERHGAAPTRMARLRRAIRHVATEAGVPWQAAYPTVERVWLLTVGVPEATLIDLLAVLADHTSLAIHLLGHPAVAPAVRRRLPAVLGVAAPGREVVTT